MDIRRIAAILNAKTCCDDLLLDQEVENACGSDMMSDVLAFALDHGILLTGLVNAQVIRTAHMMDMCCVAFLRGKTPTPETCRLAEENGIAVLLSEMGMYEACGLLYEQGLGRK
ncbi:MAG TPA: hypothetical protein PLM48_06220 [Clostridia bacterium]|nr:hypothetical protein [Clostridia bacterium]